MTELFINNFQDHLSIISVNTETIDNDDDNNNKNKSDEYNAFLSIKIKGLYADLLLCIVLQPSGSSTTQLPSVEPYNPRVEPYNSSVLNHTTPQCWTIQTLSVEPNDPLVLNHTTPQCWTIHTTPVSNHTIPQCSHRLQRTKFAFLAETSVPCLHSNGYFIFNACSFFLVYSQDILLSLLLVIFLSACLYSLCACTCVLNSCFL